MATVQGLRELEQALSHFPDVVRRDGYLRAITAGALVLARGIRQRAPRGSTPRRRKGHPLADHIVATVQATPEGAVARIGPDKDAFHGLFQEFGTRHQRARPFMRPALDEDAAAIFAAIQTSLRQSIAVAAASVRSG